MQLKNIFKKQSGFVKSAVFAVGSVALANSAMAAGTGPDLTALTSSIDVTTVITAILAIGVLLAGLALAILGVSKVVGFLSTKR